MMRKSLLFLPLILLPNLGHTAKPVNTSQIKAERATEQEAREAREVAAEFMRRLQETRDIAALKDLYVGDFVRRSMKSDRASLHGFGTSLGFNPDLRMQASRDDWERLYAATVNLRYFMVLHLASSDLKPDDEITAEKAFPPGALALLDASPFFVGDYGRGNRAGAKYKIETLQEMREVIVTLEQAGAVMRDLFLKSPPELTERYKENMSAWSPTAQSQKELSRPPVDTSTEEWFGLPRGTRFFHVMTRPPLFEMRMAKTDGGMKIVWAHVYPFN